MVDPVPKKQLRVAAYAVCLAENKILLARWIGPNGPQWTLPGGGLDHGEDPLDAVHREVGEETGYTITVERLLGMDTIRRVFPRAGGTKADFHGLRIVYAARVIGGELRHEVGGSTDQAAWFDLASVPELHRVELIDVALRLADTRPLHGRADVQS